mmetsp:Transcript_26379/g.73697  ORF Transcript_26379/g.73697 Transcript_26379/m.73697 type:complete len:590 (+) Transcript_26379:88-1857(+)
MSRRRTGNSLGSLRPGDRVEIFRKEWLAAEVESVVDGRVSITFFEQGSTKRKSLHVHDDSLRIPPAVILPHAAVSPHIRPSFLAIDVTDEMKQVQRSSPTMWAMTLVQWNQFVDFCKSTPVWQEIKNQKGHVNLYDMNERFVIPWTRGTGCSVAVLMNKHTPLEAKVMLSHAWAEDMEECREALNKHFDDEHIAKEIAVWFCGFGLYQPEDGHGPTIQEQIELHPFTNVIASESVKTTSGRMIAVHTTRADLWERLWCVREVREAMSHDVNVKAAFSTEYVNHFKSEYSTMINNGCSHQDGLDAAGITVRTARANCRKEDKPMLLQELVKHGNLEEVDKITTDLRASLVYHLVFEVALVAAKGGKPQALIELTKLGDLGAVDGLREVAEIGDRQAHDALCDKLQSFACFPNGRSLNKQFIGEPDPQDLKLKLAVVLLQIMAQMGHAQSCQFLLKMDMQTFWIHEVPGTAYFEPEQASLWRECSFPILQNLAKQGNEQVAQQAVDELVRLSKTQKGVPADSPIYHRQLNCADAALVSLALHWNQQALKALMAIVNEEDEENNHRNTPSRPIHRLEWARYALEKCRRALRS